jgi:hypothetical protein
MKVHFEDTTDDRDKAHILAALIMSDLSDVELEMRSSGRSFRHAGWTDDHLFHERYILKGMLEDVKEELRR